MTKHAQEKLRTPPIINLKITKPHLDRVITKPSHKDVMKNGETRSVGFLSQDLSLCVIHKIETRGIIKVITFFPSQKGRYENPIL